MLPTSHYSPIESLGALVPPGDVLTGETHRDANATVLADAFTRFIQSSSRLEEVYRQLQQQIHMLTQQLAKRNAELKESLADNEAMRSSLQQIVDTMPCGVLVTRWDGAVAMINPECYRMLGFETAGADHASTLQLHDLASRVGVEYTVLLECDAEQEFRIHSHDGERWISVRNRRIGCADNTRAPGDRVLVLRDITARKRAEADRENGRKAMALAETATILAHEIRNPLASLELFSDLIEKDEERRSEWVSNLRAGVRMLSSTVNNVLNLQRQPVLFALVDIDCTITCAVNLLQPLALQAGVTVERFTTRSGLMVWGSAAGLQQVMVNLILNAIRYTPANGSITVAASDSVEQPGWVVMECVDSGPGIDATQQERIFEAGYSGSGDTPGLGLAVCARIVEQHGGRIRAANVPSGGACFTVAIPLLSLESAL